MAMCAAVVLCLIVLVTPAFSDDPKSTGQPEFYFTRLMYRDVRGRGGPGSGSAPEGDCAGGAILSGGIANGG